MKADSLKLALDRHQRLLWWAALAGIFVSAGVMIWALPVQEVATYLVQWSQTEQNASIGLFVGAFVLLTVLSLPVWPLPFIAGAMFGPLWGALLASGACLLGATVTFFLARALRATTLASKLEASPRMRAMEKTVSAGSWKVVAAVRLSHLLPFGLQNYGFGFTNIAFRTFLLTTWLITLPGMFLQAWIGHLGFATLEAWQQQNTEEWTAWLLKAGGLLILIAAISYLLYLFRSVYWREAQRQLDQELQREEQDHRQQRWPIATLALLAMATVFASLATWSVVEREALHTWVANRL